MRKRSIILLIVGIIMVLGAGFLSVHNVNIENRAYAGAEQTEKAIAEIIPVRENPVVKFNPEIIKKSVGVSAAAIDAENEEPEQTVTIDGIKYLGIIDLPTARIKLPVCAEFSYDNMAVSPCRWVGRVSDNNMIICGHNYRRHFGRLDNLKTGDKATFTDVDGFVYDYKVVGTEIINGSDPRSMVSGDWDLTLFTCTLDGSRRITVRLVRT